MSKEERDEETQAEKKQDERSKRKEDRHQEDPGTSSEVKHAGSLIQQGYRVDEGQLNRRTALNKAVHHYGYAETVEKVTAISVENRNHKENHRRILDDLDYLKNEFKNQQ